MVAAMHFSKRMVEELNVSVRQRSREIRSNWTPEERKWRAYLATRKLALLLPSILADED